MVRKGAGGGEIWFTPPMPFPRRFGLSEREKDALLAHQQDMVALVSEREALVGKPRKASSNSHIRP